MRRRDVDAVEQATHVDRVREDECAHVAVRYYGASTRSVVSWRMHDREAVEAAMDSSEPDGIKVVFEMLAVVSRLAVDGHGCACTDATATQTTSKATNRWHGSNERDISTTLTHRERREQQRAAKRMAAMRARKFGIITHPPSRPRGATRSSSFSPALPDARWPRRVHQVRSSEEALCKLAPANRAAPRFRSTATTRA